MTESEYTPTTERVRECYSALRRGSGTYAPDEFDRWLREHDAKLLRDAAEEIQADQIEDYGVVPRDVIPVLFALKTRADAVAKGEGS